MIAAAMEVSLPNEPCVDLHPGLSSVNLPTSAEDPWKDEKQESEMEQEPGMTTQDANKDVNSAKLQCHSSNSKQEKNVHECSVCHKRFSLPYRLKRHSLIHTDERPFPCPICSYGFRDSSHLKVHFLRMHSGSVKKKASFLRSNRFNRVTSGQASKSSLKRPVYNSIGKTHSVSKCLTLQRDVVSRDKQSRAMYLIKKYPIVEIRNFLKSDLEMIKGHWCHICIKCFQVPSKLDRHLLSHSNKKPFKCMVCSKAFQQKPDLKRHKCNGELELRSSLPDVPKPVGKRLNGNQEAPLRLTRSNVVKFEDTDTLKDAKVQTSTSSPVDPESESKGVYQCSICLKTFEYPCRLSRHLVSHTDVRPFKCNVCSKTFRTLSHLRCHQLIHKKTVKKTVSPVSKSSDLMSKCELQEKSGHQCGICLKVFDVPSKLERHLPVHLDVKACTICGKTFRQACHLYEHMKLHRREENGSSKLCEVLQQNGAQSSTPGTNDCRLDDGNVSLPQVFHTKIYNTNAEVCKDTDNSSPTNLKESKGVNQCIICRKIFPYPSKLYRHLLSHADVKPYKCHLCSQSFQHQCHLRWHQMVHKKRIPPVFESSYRMYARQLKKKSEYQCKVCLKSFTKALNLSKHLALHTSKRNDSLKMCEVQQEDGAESSTPGTLDGTQNCGVDDSVSLPQTFDSDNTQRDGLLECNSMLNEHVLSIEIATTVEIESSDVEENRNPEVETSTSSSNQCSICLKTFQNPSKLSRHILSHTNIKPFKCSVCSKSFQHRRHLLWHQILHKKRIPPVSKSSDLKFTRPLKKRGRYWCELCLKSFTQACYLKKHLKLHTRKRSNPPKFSEVLQENGAQSSPCTLKGTNNCELDDGNVSIFDSVDSHTGEMLESKSMLNQHEIDCNDTKDNKNTVVRTSSPTNYVKSRGVNQCRICLKVFKCFSELSRHLLSHTDNKPFKCNVCSKSFQHRCQLRWHQRIHKKIKSYDIMDTHQLQKKLYRCEICLMSFRKTLYLENHLKSHTEERNGPSGLCDIPQENGGQSSTSGTLDGTSNCGLDGGNVSLPQLVDSMDTRLECNSMINQHVPLTESKSDDMEIESVDGLNNEEVLTSASTPTNLEKPESVNQCSICMKTFQYPSRLSRHLLIHTDVKPFKCKVCSKSFRLLCHLQGHELTHIKPGKKAVLKTKRGYQCKICWKMFIAPSKLKRHLRGHSNVKTYACTICGKTFRQSCHLDEHMKLHTGDENSPSKLSEVSQQNAAQSSTPGTLDGTNDCGLEGGNVSPIREYLDTQTDEMLQSNGLPNQNVHLKKMVSITVEIEGDDTGIEENKDTENTTATSLKSKSVNQCNICMKTFQFHSRLSKHLLIHTDIKPFKCNVCSKSFRFREHLRRHQMIHKKQLKRGGGYQCEICWRTFVAPSQLKKHLCFPLEDEQNRAQSSTPGTLDGTIDGGLDGANVSSPQIFDSVNTQTNKMVESNSFYDQNVPLTDTASITVKIEGNDTDAEENKDTDTTISKSVNQCSICLKVFQYPSMLSRHVLTHTDIKPFKCNVCLKSFRDLSNLRSHQMIHKTPVPPGSMSSDLMDEYQLRKDIRNQCEICWKVFSGPYKLKKHRRIHLDVKTYICTICGDSFRQSSNLVAHMKFHKAERNGSSKLREVLKQNGVQSSTPGTDDYALDDCDVSLPPILESLDTQTNNMLESNSFFNQNVPSADMAPITGEMEGNDIDAEKRDDTDSYRPTNLKKSVNQCSICMKIFRYPSGLVRHILTHTDIKPFECHVCSKSFRRLWDLRQHLMVHQKKGEDIIAGHKEQDQMDLFGNPVISKDQDVLGSSQNGADDFPVMCQDQNMFTNNMLSQKMSGDSSDSGVFFSSGTSLLQNVQVNPASEVAFQYSNKSVYGLMPNTDFSSLVEKTPSDIVPFGRVSDCPPKTDSSPLYCASDSRAEGNWAGHKDEIKKDFSFVDLNSVKHDHDSYMSRSCAHPQKLNDPDLKQDVVVGRLGIQETGGHFTQPQRDHDSYMSRLCTYPQKLNHSNLGQEVVGRLGLQDPGGHFTQPSHDHDSYMSRSCSYPQKLNNPDLRQEVIVGRLGLQDTGGHFTQSQRDHDSYMSRSCSYPQKLNDSNLGQEVVGRLGLQDTGGHFTQPPRDHDSYMSRSCSDPQKLNDSNLGQVVVGRLGLHDTGKHFTQPPRDILVCPDCSQCFSTEIELYTHKCANQHPDEKMKKSFQCDVCFKTFDMPSKLKRHSISHSGLRPFQCTVCQKTYTRGHILKSHMLKSHTLTQVEEFLQGLPNCDQSNEMSL